MLIDADKLIGYPVVSLHMGGQIAEPVYLIVDPDKLKLVAMQVVGPEVGMETGDLLQTKDVREFSDMGMIIDSIDELVNDTDVIRLRKVLELNFDLIGMKVETKKGTKLGKVVNYTVNPETWEVQQIIVQRPLMKSFIDPELTIGRSEIVKIDDYKIIVKDEEAKIRKNAANQDFVPNFINPFREVSGALSLQESSPTVKEPV